MDVAECVKYCPTIGLFSLHCFLLLICTIHVLKGKVFKSHVDSECLFDCAFDCGPYFYSKATMTTFVTVTLFSSLYCRE